MNILTNNAGKALIYEVKRINYITASEIKINQD